MQLPALLFATLCKKHVELDQIFYIESNGRRIIIKTSDGIFEQYRNISDEEKRLKELGFIRTHRSYLVNMKNIYRITPSEILLKNKESVPLSPRKYKVVYDEFTIFLIRRLK